MRIVLHLLLIAVTVSSVLIMPLKARGWVTGSLCSEPMAPTCLDSFYAFEDKWTFNACRSEVELYVSQMKSYLGCLELEENEKEDKIQELQSEIKESQLVRTSRALKIKGAISRFNCKAKGGEFCP